MGAMQSGALSYFAAGCPVVVGLDGVVDPAAARALREGKLSDYAAARGMTYFADWAYNRNALAFFSSFAQKRPLGLRRFATAMPQGTDRFEVFSVIWKPTEALGSPNSECCRRVQPR